MDYRQAAAQQLLDLPPTNAAENCRSKAISGEKLPVGVAINFRPIRKFFANWGCYWRKIAT
jgi:hypothetical protein